MDKKLVAVGVAIVIILIGIFAWMNWENTRTEPCIKSIIFSTPEYMLTDDVTHNFMFIDVSVDDDKSITHGDLILRGGPHVSLYYHGKCLGTIQRSDSSIVNPVNPNHVYQLYYDIRDIGLEWSYGNWYVYKGEILAKQEITMSVDPSTYPSSWKEWMLPNCTVKVV